SVHVRSQGFGAADPGGPARLVLGERLRGIEVEGAGGNVARERVEHRQVEGERLASGGAGGDDRVSAPRGLERVRLVRPERLDARRGQALAEGRVKVLGDGLR